MAPQPVFATYHRFYLLRQQSSTGLQAAVAPKPKRRLNLLRLKLNSSNGEEISHNSEKFIGFQTALFLYNDDGASAARLHRPNRETSL